MISRRQFLIASAAVGFFHHTYGRGRGQSGVQGQPGKYYLAPWLWRNEQFIPQGVGQGQPYWHIDLRPNPGAIDGYCFLYLEGQADDPANLILLTNDSEEALTPGKINQLERALGVTITTSLLADVIEEVLMDPALGLATTLLPSQRRQLYETFLKTRIKSTPVVDGYWGEPLFERVFNHLRAMFTISPAHAQAPITESWDGCTANAQNDINCDLNWDRIDSAGTMNYQIQVNGADDICYVRKDSGGGFNRVWQHPTNVLGSENHYSQIEIFDWFSSNNNVHHIGACTRCPTVLGAEITGYVAVAKVGQTTLDSYVTKFIDNSETPLISDTGIAPSQGALIRCEADGTTIGGSLGGQSLGAVTDATIGGANAKVAWHIINQTCNACEKEVDKFEAGTLGVAPSNSIPAILKHLYGGST